MLNQKMLCQIKKFAVMRTSTHIVVPTRITTKFGCFLLLLRVIDSRNAKKIGDDRLRFLAFCEFSPPSRKKRKDKKKRHCCLVPHKGFRIRSDLEKMLFS